MLKLHLMAFAFYRNQGPLNLAPCSIHLFSQCCIHLVSSNRFLYRKASRVEVLRSIKMELPYEMQLIQFIVLLFYIGHSFHYVLN